MKTTCARCGDCCDPVEFSRADHESIVRDASTYAPGSDLRASADFIATHWTPIDDDHCACDQFDSRSRLCSAHENRPPVCRDFPGTADPPPSLLPGHGCSAPTSLICHPLSDQQVRALSSRLSRCYPAKSGYTFENETLPQEAGRD